MKFIASEQAPKAIGPYSQAVATEQFIFTSGQIPLDPQSGKLVEGDFAVHARRVFENLRGVLEAAGASFSDVVKATVFLKQLSDFEVLNGIYAEYFGDHKPARSTVAVAQLPKDAVVEIELIAIKR